MTLDTGKQGIIFAAAGSSCPEAQTTFDRIGRQAALRFPHVGVRWAFTSSGVRRKLDQQGRHMADPAEALSAMQEEGFTRVAVTSLHMTDGMEYSELSAIVDSFKNGTGPLTKVTLGPALMADADNWRQTLSSVLEALPVRKVNEAVVLVAHGSLDPRAVATFADAIAVCRQVDPALFLGMILGSPSQKDILEECRVAGIRKVWLIPCLVAVGLSVQDVIMGSGEESWKSCFERAGITCVPVFKGLGDYDGIVDVWMNQSRRLLEVLLKPLSE